MIDFSFETLQTMAVRLEADQETGPDRAFLKDLVRDFLSILENNTFPETFSEASNSLNICNLENQYLGQSLQTRIAQLDAILRISVGLTGNQDFNHVLKSILLETLRLLPEIQEGAIHSYENGRLIRGAILHSEEQEGVSSIPLRPQGLTYTVARLGKILAVGDMTSHPLYSETGRKGSIIGLPLKIGPRVVGVITAYRSTVGDFTTDEEHLLQMMANLAALTIENGRLRSLAEQRSQLDPLTGLHNQRSLEERLNDYLLQYKAVESTQGEGAAQRSIALLMMEVDNFEAIHETYGNLAGDYIFKEITFSVNQALRKTDFLARYGRNELALVLKDTDTETARHIALRVQDFVNRTRFNLPNIRQQSLSVSIGLAFFPENATTVEEWIKAGREALVEARDIGDQKISFSIHKPLTALENPSSSPN